MKAWLAAIGTAALAAGCGGDAETGAPQKPPPGIISDRFARSIRLDMTLPRFKASVRMDAVRTTTEHQERTLIPVKSTGPKPAPPRIQREFIRKATKRFGKPKDGHFVVPARDFTCLHFHGEDFERYSWKFCFDDEQRLQFVTTGKPIADGTTS